MSGHRLSLLYSCRLAWERFKLSVSETLIGIPMGRCNATSPESDRCVLKDGHPGSHIPKKGRGWAWG